jgi:hypothetical protein
MNRSMKVPVTSTADLGVGYSQRQGHPVDHIASTFVPASPVPGPNASLRPRKGGEQQEQPEKKDAP